MFSDESVFPDQLCYSSGASRLQGAAEHGAAAPERRGSIGQRYHYSPKLQLILPLKTTRPASRLEKPGSPDALAFKPPHRNLSTTAPINPQARPSARPKSLLYTQSDLFSDKKNSNFTADVLNQASGIQSICRFIPPGDAAQ